MKIYILQQHYSAHMQRESYTHGVFTSLEACVRPATKVKLKAIEEFGANLTICTRIDVSVYEADPKTAVSTGFIGAYSVGENADLWDVEFANTIKRETQGA